MASTVREVEVLEGFFDKESPKINVQYLADFFGVEQKEVTSALDIATATALASPEGKVRTWLAIFNLLVEVITEAEPELTNEAVKQRMKVWLNLPRPEFESQTPLRFMLKGKGRKVKVLLEQLLG